MKQFFTIAFGGMAAIFIGIGLSYGSAAAWKVLKPRFHDIHVPSMSSIASTIMAGTEDGTSISGIKRTIRFSADEEEDAINAATRSLPLSYAQGVTAGAYLVKNLTSASSPVAHNPDQLMPIASLTKLVTAEVARKFIATSAKISITKKIMATYGNTAQFKVGETFMVGDLLYPLLMVSSNDAAEAYAQSYGRAKFIAAMNDFTQSIGAYRTHFSDPSGLSPANISTANDLALILNWIRKNDAAIISITQLKNITVRSHTWINPTHFLSLSNYAGGKNGYIPEANRTGASLFNVGKNRDLYAVIVLGSESRDNDELKLLAKVNN